MNLLERETENKQINILRGSTVRIQDIEIMSQNGGRDRGMVLFLIGLSRKASLMKRYWKRDLNVRSNHLGHLRNRD